MRGTAPVRGWCQGAKDHDPLEFKRTLVRAPTGYGSQTALLTSRLRDLGHEVAVSAFWGLTGAPLDWHGIPVYPAGRDPFGNDILAGHAAHFGADVVITLMDMWVLDPGMLSSLPVACWMPVDTDPLGKADYAVLAQAGNIIPVAMSRFGEAKLRDAGFSPLYCPHGIDTSIFAPPEDRQAAKEALGVGGKFVIGVNAANKDAFRKGFGEQFHAFAKLHARHPDTILAVHSQVSAPGALDLRSMAAQLGILEAVMFADQYQYAAGMISPGAMAAWYQALDLYSCCSYGEGFGIPIVEAQSCGVPVAVTDASAMSELCGTGWKVPGQPVWNPAHHSWWSRPDTDAIARVYEKAYTDRKALAARAAKAREFALQYDADRVLKEHWVPALAEIGDRLASQPRERLAK